MTHQALARKYRPKTFEEIVGQHAVVTALINALDKQIFMLICLPAHVVLAKPLYPAYLPKALIAKKA